MKKYNGETIKDAVKDIKGGEYIIRAFEATRESDLFMGDLEKYLKVIALKLEWQNVMLRNYRESMESFQKDNLEMWHETYKQMERAIHKEIYS
jgi:hypothetical protein